MWCRHFMKSRATEVRMTVPLSPYHQEGEEALHVHCSRHDPRVQETEVAFVSGSGQCPERNTGSAAGLEEGPQHRGDGQHHAVW